MRLKFCVCRRLAREPSWLVGRADEKLSIRNGTEIAGQNLTLVWLAEEPREFP